MTDFLRDIEFLKNLYNDGQNIMDYIKKQSLSSINTTHAIRISYDLQAGSYIKMVEKNAEYIDAYTAALANVVKSLGPINSIMEAGVGEATTLGNLLTKLESPSVKMGFDISWSRIKYANSYLNKLNVNGCELFVADLFNIPLADNSIDVVYTSHSVEPNGGNEKVALEELYRVANKYLILLEPAFEFASAEAKERMQRLGYATNIFTTIQQLGYKVVEHRLFDVCSNPLNPTGLIIIEKNTTALKKENLYICPVSKAPMQVVGGSFYCNKSMLLYPIFDKIPCLLESQAMLATHYIS